MPKIKLNLTDEHIRLISNIRFTPAKVSLYDEFELNDLKEFAESSEQTKKTIDAMIAAKTNIPTLAVDMHSLYGGNHVMEDISYILGIYDKHIPGTEEDALGAQFPEEIENHMWDLHNYIVENLENIEELVHQFIGRGGITPGTYVTKDYQHIWSKEENKKEV